MALQLVKATIPAGQSLSNGVSLAAGRILRIRTPPQWKSANLTFQCASADVPAEYRDVYRREGIEVVIQSVKANTVIALPADISHWLQEAWIKVRSGHAGIVVPQPVACEFEFVLMKGQTTATLLPAGFEEDEDS